MYGFLDDEQQTIIKQLNISLDDWQQRMTTNHKRLSEQAGGSKTLFDLPIQEWYGKVAYQARVHSENGYQKSIDDIFYQLGFSDIEIAIIKNKSTKAFRGASVFGA